MAGNTVYKNLAQHSQSLRSLHLFHITQILVKEILEFKQPIG